VILKYPMEKMITILRIIFVSFLVLSQIKLQSQPQPDRVFEYLNLDYPGLEKVKDAVENNDFVSAKTHLLTYFTLRSNRKANFNKHFLKVNIQKADQNAQNIFDIKTYKHDFGKQVDWRITKEEKEWQFSLSRMEWFLNYVGAYQKSYDEKYVFSWMNQCESFINLNEPGFPRTIDTGRRMESWVISHWMFVHELNSSSITPEFNAKFLASLAEQAEYIYKPENWRRFSNWGTFENSGLSLFVILFPEFKDNPKWLKEIYYRMRSQLKDSFFSDGLHIETAPSYHIHELQVWFNFIKLAELNGVSDPWKPQIENESNKELILPKALALMYMYNPLGVIPQISDSDETDERESLKEIADYWNNDALKYVATNGDSGKSPIQKLVSFPYGGYSILRSGWGKEKLTYNKELYMLFDHGNNKPWHAHFDIFNVVASAYGHELLVDPGRYTYTDGIDREKFISTAVHNTVTVDSKNQIKNYSAGPAEIHNLKNYSYVVGKGKPYDGVTHARSIFFSNKEYWIVVDRLNSDTEHTYTQNWNLSDRANQKTTLDSHLRVVSSPNLSLVFPNSSSITLEEGEVSYEYRKKITAPVIKAKVKNAKETTLPVIVYPFENVKPNLKANNVVKQNNVGAVEVVINGEHFIDYFCEREDSSSFFTSKEIESDARVIYIRTDINNKIKSYVLVAGSYLNFNNQQVIQMNGNKLDVELNNGTVSITGTYLVKASCSLTLTSSISFNEIELPVTSDKGFITYLNDGLK